MISIVMNQYELWSSISTSISIDRIKIRNSCSTLEINHPLCSLAIPHLVSSILQGQNWLTCATEEFAAVPILRYDEKPIGTRLEAGHGAVMIASRLIQLMQGCITD